MQIKKMEKQATLKNKILKIASAVSVTFQNPPFSPGRDHNKLFKPHGGKGVSMIPDEARRRPKNHQSVVEITQEPTSPKISCMGQIKHKKKQINKSVSSKLPLPVDRVGSFCASSTPPITESSLSEVKKPPPPKKFHQRMFLYGGKPKTGRRKSCSSRWGVDEGKKVIDSVEEEEDNDTRAPPVGEMRRFASGRETFSNFDWKASQVAPEDEIMEYRGCYTDDERVEEEDEEEEEVKIPFSAPILVGDDGGSVPNLQLQPRKEINLWKRRTMERPRPLLLKPVLTAS